MDVRIKGKLTKNKEDRWKRRENNVNENHVKKIEFFAWFFIVFVYIVLKILSYYARMKKSRFSVYNFVYQKGYSLLKFISMIASSMQSHFRKFMLLYHIILKAGVF